MKIEIKHIVGLLLITLLIVNARCKNESNAAPKIVKRDTANTIIGTVGYQRKTTWFGEARRITADSFAFYKAKTVGDSIVTENRWKKVTYYLVYMPVMVDSVISVKYNVPRYDSLGKPYPVNLPFHFEPKYVVDGITDIDSAKRYLDQFLIKETVKNPS